MALQDQDAERLLSLDARVRKLKRFPWIATSSVVILIWFIPSLLLALTMNENLFPRWGAFLVIILLTEIGLTRATLLLPSILPNPSEDFDLAVSWTHGQWFEIFLLILATLQLTFGDLVILALRGGE
jgi:hypothetical protein